MRFKRKKSGGRLICVIVFDKNGLALRVLPNHSAANSWIDKHIPNVNDIIKRSFCSRVKVLREFDRQMQLGLINRRVINDLIDYGGV